MAGRRRGSRGRRSVFVAVLICGVGVWWSAHRSAPVASATRPFDSINLTRLTTTGTARLAAMSNDGRYVAHVTAKGGQLSLLLRQVATTSNVEIVPPAEVRYIGVAFSPDGNHIYYATYAPGKNIGLLYQVPVLGGGSRLILEDVDTVVSFSPDGKEFAFVRGFPDEGKSAVMVASADGSKQRAIATRKRPLRFPLAGGRMVARRPVHRRHRRQTPHNSAGTSSSSTSRPDRSRCCRRPTGGRSAASRGFPTAAAFLPPRRSQPPASRRARCFSSAIHRVRRDGITNDLSTYFGLSVAPDGRSFVCIRNERLATIWTMPLNDASDGRRPSPPTRGPTTGSRDFVESRRADRLYDRRERQSRHLDHAGGRVAPGAAHVAQGQDVRRASRRTASTSCFVSDRDGGLRAWRMGLDGSGATRLSPDQIARGRVYRSARRQMGLLQRTSLVSRGVCRLTAVRPRPRSLQISVEVARAVAVRFP